MIRENNYKKHKIRGGKKLETVHIVPLVEESNNSIIRTPNHCWHVFVDAKACLVIKKMMI